MIDESALKESRKRILKILAERPVAKRETLLNVVKYIRKKRGKILEIAKKHDTPFYLIDGEALENGVKNFKRAFTRHVPDCTPYYAMKANSHPAILASVLRHGFGIDASSGRELTLALKAGAKDILFSGPGKTEKELKLALRNDRLVTVNIDSFSELKKLGRLAEKTRTAVRAGVRIFSPVQSGWSKFGIPVDELNRFWNEAKKYRRLKLQGIQFHISWNRNPSRYVRMIGILGSYLKKSFTEEMRGRIKFIDFGGGFYPDRAEGYYPWAAHYPGSWPGGKIASIADAYYGVKTQFKEKYSIIHSSPVEDFALEIGKAIKKYLHPLVKKCSFYTEPGRIIANNAMHIAVRIADRKGKDFVIADGGVNIIGWEYGESFYYPLINLSHPSDAEMECTVYGPLCTPHDIWGYYCYAKKMEEGDVIVIPNQGAYKHVLAQNFIKEIPEVRMLDER